MTDALPASWTSARLAELAAVNPSRVTPDADPTTAFNFVGMASIREYFGGIDVTRLRPLMEVAKGFTQFTEGDVLLAKITPCFENGKLAVVPPLVRTLGYGSTELHVLRPSHGVEAKWLAYWLARAEFRSEGRRNMKGSAGQLRVPRTWLEEQVVPVAPSAEQRRIVAKIEELLSNLEAGIAAIDRVRLALRRYRASVLKAATDGTLTRNGLPHALLPIADVVASVEQGWSPKCEGAPADDPEAWGIIKTTAIQPLRFLPEHNKKLPSSLDPRPRLELVKDDLLMTRAGPRSRVGVACLVTTVRPRLMLCDKVYRLRCRKSIILPAYLEVVLNAPAMVDALDRLKTGISDSGVNLTQGRVSQLLIPVPALEDQADIVGVVEDQLSMVEHVDGDLEAKLARANSLRAAILDLAFRGRLVTQDPSEESASELLEHIMAEREGGEEHSQRRCASPEAKDELNQRRLAATSPNNPME